MGCVLKLSLSPSQRKWVIPNLIGLIITSFFLAAYLAQPAIINRFSYLSSDILQRLYPRTYNPDSPVRIIDIDDESIRRIGQWPWPRTTMAKLNDRLSEAGAAVLAYDIVFSEADRTSPENMLSVLQANPNAKSTFKNISLLKSHDDIFADSFANSRVVTGLFLVGAKSGNMPLTQHSFAFSGSNPTTRVDNYGGTIHPIKTLEKSASGLGHVSFHPDTDGVIRSAPLLGRVNERLFPSLSMEALRVVQGAQNFIVKSSNASGELASQSTQTPEMAAMKVGEFEIPTTANGNMIVYYSAPAPERYIPAWKIISDNPQDHDWADLISGHVVFIGTGAEGLKDIRATPIRESEPGVLIHAQIIEQVIEGDYLKRPYWASMFEILSLALYGLLISLLVPRLTAARGVILFLTIINLAYFAVFIAYTRYKYVIDPVYPLLAAIGTYIGVTLSSFYLTETERSRIRNAFSMYLSPDMVKQVSENPDSLTLGGQERELTILFLDIRGFSRLSEQMTPFEITTFLNNFLTPMTDILQKHNATIDKYMGDAIVAFWNAPLDDPDHVKNSAQAVLKIQEKLSDLNRTYILQQDFEWPGNVQIGVGLNTGICCVGNLGSEQRFSYSMIGDAANLASRIEGLTKQYGVQNLIGNTTAERLNDFAVLEIDIVNVVGRTTPEPIFVILEETELLDNVTMSTLYNKHQSFLTEYRNQSWDLAVSIAQDLKTAYSSLGLEKYYAMMIDRIETYKQDPPASDWDGVYHALSK